MLFNAVMVELFKLFGQGLAAKLVVLQLVQLWCIIGGQAGNQISCW